MSGLEFGSSSVELNSARPRVNVTEAYATLALRARRNTQLLAQALSVIITMFDKFPLFRIVIFVKIAPIQKCVTMHD